MGANSSHLLPGGTNVVVVVVGAIVVVGVRVVVGATATVVVGAGVCTGVVGIVGICSCVLTCPLHPTRSRAAVVRVSLRKSFLLDRG